METITSSLLHQFVAHFPYSSCHITAFQDNCRGKQHTGFDFKVAKTHSASTKNWRSWIWHLAIKSGKSFSSVMLCIMLKSSQAYFENLAMLKPPDFQSMFDRCSKLFMKGLNLLNLLDVLPRDVSLKIVDILQSLGNEISHVSETLAVRAIVENPLSNPSPETEPNYLSRESGWSRKEFTREQIQN